MLYENKLTNLVFNAKKINAKTQFASFSFLFYFILLFYLFEKNLKKKSQNEMHGCNAMQILETKKTKTKEQWSQKVEQ